VTPLSLVSPTIHRERALRYGPVFATNQFDRPTACLFGTAASAEFLRTHADAIERAPQGVYRFVPGGFLRRMRGAEHKHERAQLGAALPPRLVEELAPSLRAGFDAMLQQLAGAGGTGALARPAIDRTVFALVRHAFFGVPVDSPLLAALRRHHDTIDPLNRRDTSDADIEAAFRALEQLIATHADERSTSGGLPPCALREVLRRHPGALADSHTMRTLLLFAHNGSYDVTGLITWIWKMLSDHRTWVDALRADFAAGPVPGPGSLADHLVSETLRMTQAEYLNLMVGREIHHDGYVIPRGWGLRVCVTENHRDPAVFEDPDEFRPDRWARRSYSRVEYAPFGLDDHFCLGENLARTIARAFVAALASGYDWDVLDDGPREMSGRQHWAPSSRFRVAVTPRPAIAPV
jgi:cytochrome P450